MRFIKLLTFFILSILLGACGGGGSSGTIDTPLPSGSATTTLTIQKTNLYSTNSAPVSTTVTAVFTNNGVPIPNLSVTFSATPGLVTFAPLNGAVVTDAYGVATITMTGLPITGVGQVKVSTTVNGAIVEQYAPFYLNSPSLHLANMSFNPTSVAIGGSSTVMFDILDSDNNLYTQQDLDVYLTSTSALSGFVTDNQVDRVRSDKGRVSVTYVTVTGSSISSDITDIITATFGSSNISKIMTIKPLGSANISYSYTQPTKTGIGYNETVSFVFKVTDIKGTGLPNQKVKFIISGAASGSVVTSEVLTDYTGNATATLKAGTTSTTLWVTATLDGVGVTAQSAVISVGPLTAAQISSSTAAATIAFNGSKTVTFNVKDTSGVNLSNQLVSFYVVDVAYTPSTNATLQSYSAYTDASGNVTAVLLAKSVPTVVRVKATIGPGGSVVAGYSNNMTISSGVATSLTVTAETPNITSWSSTDNGTTKSLINPTNKTDVKVTAHDDLGNKSVGLLVSFVTTGGAFESGISTCTTDLNGSCKVSWINNNPVIPATGIVTITAAATGANNGTGTIVMSSAQAKINLTSCITPMPTLSQNCTISLTDLLGNALGNDTTVNLTATNVTGGALTVEPSSFTVSAGNAITIIPTTLKAAGALGTNTLNVSTTSSDIVTLKSMNIVSGMSVSVSPVVFAVGDVLNKTYTTTISGGTAPYTVVSATPADIGANVAVSTITLTKLKAVGAVAMSTTVTVTDSMGLKQEISVTYFQ